MNENISHWLIDGNAYIFRSYFGVPKRTDPWGTPNNAVYGVAKMLLNIIHHHHPASIIFVLDGGRETFRNQLYPKYKGNRPARPDDLMCQFPLIDRLLDAFGIPKIQIKNYEADDTIGTLCRVLPGEKVIVSGDKDLGQLLNDQVKIFNYAQAEWTNAEDFKYEWDIAPCQLPDLLGLIGDRVDNIPGVAGIGRGAATLLLQAYLSIDAIYDIIQHVKPDKIRNALQFGKDAAFLSRALATIKTDVLIPEGFKTWLYHFDHEEIESFFHIMGFNDLKENL